jgi:carbon storage regulator
MLVLRRKAGEAIVLNGVITIHVLAVEGERVKLGISAPPEVVIVRSELLENQAAIPGGPASSNPYWANRERSRHSRERGGEYGADGRSIVPAGRPEPDSHDPDEAPPSQEHASTEQPAPASLYAGRLHRD